VWQGPERLVFELASAKRCLEPFSKRYATSNPREVGTAEGDVSASILTVLCLMNSGKSAFSL
jgi:hypothetical protein